MKTKGLTGLIITVAMCMLTVQVAAQSTPFMIYGYVSYENGDTCNNPTVNITNLDTGVEWQAETSASYNYYQLILDTTNISVGNVIEFNATSPNGNQTNITEHTVTQEEVNTGGFKFNITLAPNVVINEFVSNNATEWVELYNKGTTSVNLSGWTLKDGALAAKPLSGMILANDYLVFSYSSGWLNNDDDIIYLNSTITNIDKVAYDDWDDGNTADNAPKAGAGESTGRFPNGVDTNNDSADFRVFDNPTSGAPNIIDTTPPWWSSPETDPETINESDVVTFFTDWNDTVALSGYIFSTNQTGSWVNESFTAFSCTPDTAEQEVTITASAGTTVGWRFYAKDTSDNWNASDIQTFVVYDTTAPASITDLQNTTYQETCINWTWTDPADADFSHVKVYLDGIYKEDVLKGVRFYNATELTHNTTYEIATRTVDESGNINATWVNHTSWTKTSSTSVEIGNYGMSSPSGTLTVPIMLQNIMGYGTATVILEYNESVVHVTNVANGSFSSVQACNINNTTGTVNISALNTSGVNGSIEFALITFEAVGGDGDTTPLTLSVQKLCDTGYHNLANHTSNGSITLIEGTPPVISNGNATPGAIIQTILSDRNRTVSRNTTTLSVNVTDTGGSGVKNVTINLTLIGGSANTSMTNGGSGDIYSVDTTATDGINLTHNLVVTAMDNNNNTATSTITLEVLRRGDVVRNDKVDIGDALYIARYTVGLEPLADNWLLVGDIVGEDGNELGDNSVDMGDALYIARYTVGLEEEP
ncbi:MAG: Lamin Tail Domain protein [Candidatus Argoarchaeum ethanivorans]|uniref:Lamin Tail Domain protein n=1 Tax=Candidatus Argoarchaeum ethanivorans TaxID=2608793 RepID=A0A811T8H6_9EURY|nr:MAG: Lamin Tail Domain protein [Candidatus Argoarchaeum ethanivorans]